MSMQMTAEEAKAALRELGPTIDRYARLAIRKGVAIRQGQELVITGPVERADFVRLLVRKAYELGAGHVTVLWTDDQISRLEYEHNELAYFDKVPAWKREQLNSLARDGASFLFVDGSDPYALDGIDAAKPAHRSRSMSEQCKEYRSGLDFGRNVWSIVGVPVDAWAKTVFPDVTPEEAEYRLWVAILHAARADGPDPLAAWDEHNKTFEAHKRFLNASAFRALRYSSSNGTNLEIGLNEGHVWEGGCSRTVDGHVFFPNIPTEEVFTSPDSNRATGIVHSVLPLVHAGRVIRDFWLRFEDGRVVDYDAASGRDVLESIITTDERSCRLGECALIAKDTPIRQSGLLFYNTLYDENASCHLALGTGFPECLEGGLNMSKEQLIEHGLNQSNTHVDFMIGADDLTVVGVTESGEEVPVFLDGRWTPGVD